MICLHFGLNIFRVSTITNKNIKTEPNSKIKRAQWILCTTTTPRDPKILVVVDMWSLFRCYFCCQKEKTVYDYGGIFGRWSPFRGRIFLRFECVWNPENLTNSANIIFEYMLTVHLHKRGYVPGEPVFICAEIDNKSKKLMNGTSAKIIQVIQYFRLH